jgi:hypothetical protein
MKMGVANISDKYHKRSTKIVLVIILELKITYL